MSGEEPDSEDEPADDGAGDASEESAEEAGVEDPFVALDEPDREGDPFDSLPGDGADGSGDDTAAGEIAPADSDWADALVPETDLTDDEGDAAAEDEEGEDPFAAARDLFDQMDVGDVDPEGVWERLSTAQQRGSVAGAGERTYADVSKHDFCEQCEFFSEPPDVSCNHEGTEILEFPDMETVEVVDCPVVAERRGFEAEE